MRQIIDHVKNNDPEAILFVFGDHGAFQSSRLKFEDDPTFFVLDRYAILGGVYPPDRCASISMKRRAGLHDDSGRGACDTGSACREGRALSWSRGTTSYVYLETPHSGGPQGVSV